MQVILLERIEKLGLMGDVVDVKPGYARNFLLPQNKALRATEANIQSFEARRVQLEADNIARRDEAEGVSGRFEGLTVVLTRQASDSAQLYGSVTKRDIAEAVAAAGFTISRNQVALDRPIKSVGLHPIRVQLHPEVSVTITANVARSQEEAELQARGETIGAEVDEDDEDAFAAAGAPEEAETGEPPDEAAVAEAPDEG
ncbi:MAG: 50S ribosomal protein L9 [Defluviicoccus sp.]|nr:50S ribosomal protein L9 [Defluviicoccus sp.]